MTSCAETPMELITIDCTEAAVIQQVTNEEILECVGSCCGVPVELILCSMRGKEGIVDARHIAMYIIRKKSPEMTLKAIADLFGKRHYSTVISALNKIDGLLDVDKKFKILYHCCLEKINEHLNNGTN